jgi:cysteine desulfurase / selenocysteine lyase
MSNFRYLFPIFEQHKGLVYLDSAATNLKLRTVIDAINDYYQKYSINFHSRSSHSLFKEVWKTIRETRQLVARKINAQPEEISFVPSATYAFNILALSCQKFLRAGEKIFLTHLEHSSNLYPWQSIAQEKGLKTGFLPLNENLIIDVSQLPNYIDEKTKIVSFFHVSNSLGTINPVAEITQRIKQINPDCLVILDACQSITYASIDVREWNIDALVFSGHKVYGPTGIGMLWLKKELAEKFPHVLWGGGKMIGPLTEITSQDLFSLNKFEVGTLPLAQIFGLKASFEFLNKINSLIIYQHQNKLRNYALLQLEKIKNIFIYNQKLPTNNIITFNLSGYHAHDIVDYCGKHDILLRGGDFCCPYLSKIIGTNSALRISFDLYNTYADIDRLIKCLREIKEKPILDLLVF